MQVRDVETGFVIRLSRGEKVIETLLDFCAKRGIQGGFFHALGAVENTRLGYYDFTKREYFFKDIPEIREVASMSGNIALVDGTPFIHAHAVLSATDLSLQCLGGHIQEAVVAVTLEIHLTPFSVPLARQYDEETGLKLLSL